MSACTTYAEQVAGLAALIQEKAKEIRVMERSRHDWIRPEGAYIHMGKNLYVVPKNGVVHQSLARIHREVLAFHDDELTRLRGELEGLRYKLIRLGREGGAA